MSRYERNTAVLIKIETAYGTDSIPVPATDALLLRKFTCKPLDIKYVNMTEVRPYFGKGMDLVGTAFVSGTFELALAGSGAAGTAPMWGRILRSCGFAEVITAASRVDYTPISAALESATMYYYDDGAMKKVLGMRCDITSFKLGYGDVPIVGVKFIGLDGGDTAVAVPTLTLTSWKPPLAVNTTNSGLLTIGCTYSAGALVGGATFQSKGLDITLGNVLNFIELLGGDSVDITDRDVNGKCTIDLTAAQEVANIATVKSGATQGVGILHGTTAGYKILTHLPTCQLKNPIKDTLNGRRVITYDLNAIPTTGNDEWRIVAL
jgi:hypothetical protein